MAGYVKLEEAARAEKEKNYSLALDLYRKARDAFAQVRSRYPDWNPALLDYRINYCDARIQRLEKAVAAGRNQMTRTELLELCDRFAAKVQNLEQKNLQLRRQLEITSRALERARTEAARSAKAAAMVPDLLKRHDDLQQRLQRAEAEAANLKAALAELDRLKRAAERADRLARERDEAVARADAAERKAALVLRQYERLGAAYSQALKDQEKLESRTARQKDELARSEAARHDIEKQLRSAQETITNLTNERNDLSRQLEKARALADQKQMRLAELTQQIADLAKVRERLDEALQTRALLERKLQNLEAKVTNLEEENKTLSQSNEEWKRRAASAEARRKEENADATRRIARYKAELKQAHEQIAALKSRFKHPGKAESAASPSPTPAQTSIKFTPPIDDLVFDVLQEAWEAQAMSEERAAALLSRTKTLETQVKALQEERRRLETNLRNAQDRAEKIAARIAALETEAKRVAELTARIEDLQARLDDEKKNRKRAEEAVAALRAVLEDRDKRLVAGAQEKAVLTQRIEAMAKELDDLRRQITSEKDAGATWREQERKLRETLAQTRKWLADEQTQRRKLEKRLAGLMELGRTQEQALQKLTQEKEALQETIKALTHDLKAARRRIRVLEDGSAVVEGLKASLEKADAALNDTRARLAAAAQEIARLRQFLDAEKNRAETAEEEARRLRASLDALRSRSRESETLRRQVHALSEQLDRARDRIAALEKSLQTRYAQRTALATPGEGTPPADARTPALTAEQKRRIRDRRMLARGFLEQGLQAEQADRKEAAVWNYRKVLEYDPDNQTALQRLGLISAEAGDDPAAVGYLSKAFYVNPDDPDILIPLGYALIRERKTDLAVSMLARAAALRPDEPAIHRMLGVAYSALGWTDAAERELRRALDLAPNDAESAFNLAVLLAARGPDRLPEAKRWYALARRNGAPSDPGLDALFGQQN